LVFTGQGLLLPVEHSQHQIGCAQIYPNVKRFCGGFFQWGDLRVRDPADDLLGVR
jgi:hypothetical protein